MNNLKKSIMFRFVEMIPKALLIPILTWWWFENWWVIVALTVMFNYISYGTQALVYDIIISLKSIEPSKGNQHTIPATLPGHNLPNLSNVEFLDIPSDSVSIVDDLVEAFEDDKYAYPLAKILYYILISLCVSIAASYTVGTMTSMLGGIVCFVALSSYTGFLTLKSTHLLRKAIDEYRDNFDSTILPYTSNVGAISLNDTMFTFTDRNLVD